MDFLEKINENPYEDLYFNIPEEQKIGIASVIGGNGQNFRTVIKTAEFIANKFPLKELKVVLPDSLKSKLPPLDNLVFLKTTEVGSFSEGEELKAVIKASDFSLIIGDLSKNTVTRGAFESALLDSEKPLILTRDSVDLVSEMKTERLLMRENLTIFGSIMQWQKIFKSVYYPKMLMASQPLIQVAEAFHKFTLSYPAQVIALHDGQILISKNGRVFVVSLAKSGYSPIMVWNGELAGKIMILNLYNPDKFLEATVAALFFR
ncbi:hypothetical protein IJG27_02760 [Candidatus Saccharibacteria bacterium]|nr:hypothetical protein [Candidatus Saccharibacteria bacterium]